MECDRNSDQSIPSEGNKINVTDSLRVNNEKMSIYNRNLNIGAYLETMGASMGTMTIGNEIVDTEQAEEELQDRYFKSTHKNVLN